MATEREATPQNMTDYEQARRDFMWEVPEDYNFAIDAVGKWAEEPDKLAILWVGPDGGERRYTFVHFDEQSSRVAFALEKLGVKKGERVLLMLPRIPEWWETMLGLMKLGAVSIPCTTLLTAKDIQYRAVIAEAAALITDRAGAEKFAQVRAQCPTIRVVTVVDELGADCPEGCVGYHPLVDVASPAWYGRHTTPSDPCLIYFTSGTVGYPKMLLHTHASYPIGHTLVTGRYWLDQRPDDLHWNLSENGWVNFLGSCFDALFPPPSHWCPLSTATPDTPETEPYFLLDQACRIVPAAYSLPGPVPSPGQDQG
ncbi:MAG TPA: AMP-binding protein [Ktedonobacterales bacterium]|jgi:acetyl-CoA synthetase/medium-chain acyl-CoA synthetase|nr:AMP-binding protein [Ktedonobacterales bacterium]